MTAAWYEYIPLKVGFGTFSTYILKWPISICYHSVCEFGWFWTFAFIHYSYLFHLPFIQFIVDPCVLPKYECFIRLLIRRSSHSFQLLQPIVIIAAIHLLRLSLSDNRECYRTIIHAKMMHTHIEVQFHENLASYKRLPSAKSKLKWNNVDFTGNIWHASG